MPRLKRSQCAGPGILRRRAGKGFVYLDEDGNRIDDPETRGRIEELAIPPAWEEVWICPDFNGHIQATGVDEAGRKQYLYHQQWSESRSTQKFELSLEFSRHLGRLRKAVGRDLRQSAITRDRASACAVRLIDLGFFRVGSEQYAEQNDTYGVATLKKSHVRVSGTGCLRFEYPAKGSKTTIQTVCDRATRRIGEELLRRRSGPEDFLVYKESRRWIDLKSGDVNEYIQLHAGDRFSAKDFRTWNATVLAAAELGSTKMPETKGGRERRMREAIGAVADLLGNTPAVCRASYVDPRVLDRFSNGQVVEVPPGWRPDGSQRVRGLLERRVRELITGS